MTDDLPAKEPAPQADPPGPVDNRRGFFSRTRILLAVLVLLLTAVGLRVYHARNKPDPRMKEVQALREKLGDPATRDLPPEQRRERLDQVIEKTRKLTPEQRKELGKPMREAMHKELKRYFALNEQERTRYLDERIKRMQALRKQIDLLGRRGGGGKPGAPAGGAAPKGGSGGRNQFRQEVLDSTDPEDRAMMRRFIYDMRQRMEQLGIETGGGKGKASG